MVSPPSGNSGVCLYGGVTAAGAFMAIFGSCKVHLAAVLGRFRRHWKRYAGMKGIRFSGGGANDGTRLSIELLEIAVKAPLAERDAPRRGEIGGNARPLGDAVVQRDDARHLALEPLHPLGEGVTQALDDLEQRQVRIGELAADEIGAAAVCEHALEIAQEFRQAVAPEIFGGELCRRALLFVIEVAGDRMMGVVDQHHEVGDGELQLMHPQPSGLVAGREAEPPAEVKQDVGGLADDELAGLQKRRRKRRTRAASGLDEFHHRGNAALAGPARHVDIVCARVLQGEADEFAAALDRRPVIELVAHGRGPSAHTRKEKLTQTISRVGAFLAFTVARYLPYAALRRGMIRSAFSRSIAIRSAPARTAPSPFTCSSPVRYGKSVP